MEPKPNKGLGELRCNEAISKILWKVLVVSTLEQPSGFQTY